MYIYLARKEDIDTRIDIRYGAVEEFIEKQKEIDELYLCDLPLRYFIDLAWTEAVHQMASTEHHLQKSEWELQHDQNKIVKVRFFTNAKDVDHHVTIITLIPQSDGSYTVDS
jgi:hypothetical protein